MVRVVASNALIGSAILTLVMFIPFLFVDFSAAFTSLSLSVAPALLMGLLIRPKTDTVPNSG